MIDLLRRLLLQFNYKSNNNFSNALVAITEGKICQMATVTRRFFFRNTNKNVAFIEILYKYPNVFLKFSEAKIHKLIHDI